jgi:hypothetical protein
MTKCWGNGCSGLRHRIDVDPLSAQFPLLNIGVSRGREASCEVANGDGNVRGIAVFVGRRRSGVRTPRSPVSRNVQRGIELMKTNRYAVTTMLQSAGTFSQSMLACPRPLAYGLLFLVCVAAAIRLSFIADAPIQLASDSRVQGAA